MKNQNLNNAAILGLLWGLLPITYLFDLANLVAFSLYIIFYIYILLSRNSFSANKDTLQIVGVLAIFILQSLIVDINEEIEYGEYLKLFLFIVNLYALSTILNHENFDHFGGIFLMMTAGVSVIHILMTLSGYISDHYGRYMFIGDSHPNLGGEIYGIAALVGAVGISKIKFSLLLAPMFMSAFLMQSRTGMIVLAIVYILKLSTAIDQSGDKMVIKKSHLLLIAIFMIFSATFAPILDVLQSQILLIDDGQRGMSVGLITGRDQRWMIALDYFYENPFLGSGVGMYASSGEEGAHSAILYALSMFGIFGGLFWIYIFWKYFLILKMDCVRAYYLFPIIGMIFFNDRFINSNSFPMLFYIYILVFSRIEGLNAGGLITKK